MSEFKGTKGKWNVKNIAYDKQWIDVSSEKGIIARTFYGNMEPIVTDKESEANALLISKATEMLEMLKDVKDYLGSDKRKEVEQLIKEATEL